eukprot:GHVT01002402.1.p3 GENE.GHVT01002402.1~~GHVT01002402.1.p3  ORF type:complete len:237 (-),score=69.51 GHVT01002402.1:415-1125(-)
MPHAERREAATLLPTSFSAFFPPSPSSSSLPFLSLLPLPSFSFLFLSPLPSSSFPFLPLPHLGVSQVTDVAPTTSGGLQQRKLLIRDIAMSCASPGGLRRWATGRFAAVRFPEVSEPPADRLKAQRQLAVGGRSYLKPDAAALLPPAGKDDLYLALSRASAAVGGLRRSPKGKEPTKRKPATISRSQFVSASLAGCWEDWTSEGSRAHLRLAVTVERSGSASPFASRIPAGKFDDC